MRYNKKSRRSYYTTILRHYILFYQYSAIEDQNMVIDDSITAREQLHSVKRTVASRKKRNIVNFQELVLRKWPAPEYTIKYKFSGEHGND